MLLWQRSSSCPIDRETLSQSVLSSSTFLTFSWKESSSPPCLSESRLFAMTHTFPLLLAKCNCLISGRGGANGVATYRSEPTLLRLLCGLCSVKRRTREQINQTWGLLLGRFRPLTPLSPLWRRRPLRTAQWTVVTLFLTGAKASSSFIFVLEKGRQQVKIVHG